MGKLKLDSKATIKAELIRVRKSIERHLQEAELNLRRDPGNKLYDHERFDYRTRLKEIQSAIDDVEGL